MKRQDRKPLITHSHVVKLGRILNMLYRPGEIGEEIGVTADTVCRSYIPAGLPHTRGENGTIWIHGPEFVKWARDMARKRKRAGMQDGFAWCLKCNKAVQLIKPQLRTINRYLEVQFAPCPICNRTVNRIRARAQVGVQ
jgi:uncharacterized protein with PIN domain